jgi:hypothetical protein
MKGISVFRVIKSSVAVFMVTPYTTQEPDMTASV